jgi:putative glutamine amidotransferase
MALIGITACRKLEDYRQSVLHVGGEVRVLEPTAPVADVLNGVDGLLLTGGEDLAPARYGAEPHPTIVDVNLARDEFELALVADARRHGLPIFAICRGIQVLNVACGGTLVRDIPSEVKGAMEHRLAVPPHEAYSLAHEVWLDKDTLLSRLMRERLSDTDSCEVNSRHHQAVEKVAPGFVASATAPDGVIEAIEDPAAPFCLGVQWHPENFWRTGEFRPLFEGFLEAAARRQPGI